jgi:hypothetical protein
MTVSSAFAGTGTPIIRPDAQRYMIELSQFIIIIIITTTIIIIITTTTTTTTMFLN